MESEQIDAAFVRREHELRRQLMGQYLGSLASLDMHPDTRTLLLEIAACPGGATFLHDLANVCGQACVTRQAVKALYDSGDYEPGLYGLFNKPY